jgi:hypothetical protein
VRIDFKPAVIPDESLAAAQADKIRLAEPVDGGKRSSDQNHSI